MWYANQVDFLETPGTGSREGEGGYMILSLRTLALSDFIGII